MAEVDTNTGIIPRSLDDSIIAAAKEFNLNVDVFRGVLTDGFSRPIEQSVQATAKLLSGALDESGDDLIVSLGNSGFEPGAIKIITQNGRLSPRQAQQAQPQIDVAEVDTNAGIQDLLLEIGSGFDELNAITTEQQKNSLESDAEIKRLFDKVAEKRKKSTGEKLRPIVSAVQTIIDRQSGSRERRQSADARQQNRQSRNQARSDRADFERRQKFSDQIKLNQLVSGSEAQRLEAEFNKGKLGIEQAKTKIAGQQQSEADRIRKNKEAIETAEREELNRISLKVDNGEDITPTERFKYQKAYNVVIQTDQDKFAEEFTAIKKGADDRYLRIIQDIERDGGDASKFIDKWSLMIKKGVEDLQKKYPSVTPPEQTDPKALKRLASLGKVGLGEVQGPSAGGGDVDINDFSPAIEDEPTPVRGPREPTVLFEKRLREFKVRQAARSRQGFSEGISDIISNLLRQRPGSPVTGGATTNVGNRAIQQQARGVQR